MFSDGFSLTVPSLSYRYVALWVSVFKRKEFFANTLSGIADHAVLAESGHLSFILFGRKNNTNRPHESKMAPLAEIEQTCL